MFGDLECLDAKNWFVSLLPAIIHEFVRTNVVRLEYRAMKTDTINPQVFVTQQTAALAAGSQDRMWNFLMTFYYEQGREYTDYVTEQYLDQIAQQVPRLDVTRWDDGRTIRFAKAVVADNRTAHALGFHDTPAFRIGRTGGELRRFSGQHVVIYPRYSRALTPKGEVVGAGKPAGYMNPLALVDARDVRTAIEAEI